MKVYFTKEEKKEFDELKRSNCTILAALKDLDYVPMKELRKRIFVSRDMDAQNQAEFEFACAWHDPSLIVVTREPKYYLRDQLTGNYLCRSVTNHNQYFYSMASNINCEFTSCESDNLLLNNINLSKEEIEK